MFSTRLRQMACASAAIVAFTASAAAEAQEQRFDIAEQPATTSIPLFARQARVQITAPGKILRGVTTPALHGSYEVRAALHQLLKDTRLRIVADAGTTITLAESPQVSASDPAPTATNSPDPFGTQDIVVTATKRSERLIDTPVPVSAIRASTLTRAGAVRLEDYVARVPGVTISNNTGSGVQTQIIFRGISTGSGGNPVAAVYVDDAPITSATQLGAGGSFPDFDPAELERIEFLRGPQGTLYGAASLGGLLKFVTRKPDFETLSGRTELDYTGAAHGGFGGGARGRINAPLGQNIALSASGFYRIDPGFIDNILTGQSNENDTRTRGGRVALAVRPVENVTVVGSVMYQAINADSVTTEDTDLTGRPLYGDLQVSRPRGTAALTQRFTLYDLSINARLNGFDLISDTSYGIQKSGTYVDYTRLIGGLLDSISGQPSGTLGASIFQPFRTKKLTQEVRLQSTTEGFFGWQIGGFYTHEDAATLALATPVYRQTGGPAASVGLPPLGNGDVDATYREIAGFGTVTLNFTSKLSLSGGLRYSDIRLSDSQTLSGILLGDSTNSGRASDHKLTFSVNPSYKIAPNILVYARVASGYRPGGPNITTSDPASYKPDTVVSYEAGTKGTLLDNHLTYDLDAFLINWDDIQVQQSKPGPAGTPLSFVDNAGKARSKGIEAAFTATPLSGLTFDANVAYTDAYFRNTVGPAVAGDRLPSSAKWTGQIGGEYRFELTDGWKPFFGGSYRYVGRRLGEFAGPGGTRYVLPHYETVDLRAGVDKDGFEASLFVRNLADKRGYTGGFVFGPYATAGLLQPRTIGLVLSKEF
jgi:outer membrane receptor protein involved in Fe transport